MTEKGKEQKLNCLKRFIERPPRWRARAREIKKLEVYKNYIIKKAKIALTN